MTGPKFTLDLKMNCTWYKTLGWLGLAKSYSYNELGLWSDWLHLEQHDFI